MNPSNRLESVLRRLSLAQLCLFLAIVSAHAQVAPTAAPDAATLAKYDTNKNGRLDPGEMAALQADEAKAGAGVQTTNATTNASSSGEVVAMSPFEVVSDTKGYYSANSMSGTRFNSKLEDLASSISVMTKEQMTDFAMLDINDIFNYMSNT